ncbi:protein serine/threonine phosphatase 2C [Fomitopsis serialis]|uniref:protein serine/threonine phosphatase 2C n=1 Tax=Fomitopsis serialis TaxID=139415 RepID=UPI00200813CA|nr:protein serine/threonine phosphatase 2C [Neoantrodia serialis]KAH9927233.1 protein serine/threonine phosphatase 2C [Neoantrodia serialis]
MPRTLLTTYSTVLVRHIEWRQRIALAGCDDSLGGPSYLYYRYYSQPRSESFDLNVRVRGADGKPALEKQTFSMTPMDQVNKRLAENATSKVTVRPGVVWKQATAQLSSNSPIEDAYSSAFVQRDPTDPAGPGDLLLFAIMDGHRSYHTSQLLSKVLLPAIGLQLQQLTTADSDPQKVALAIQSAFVNLDWEIINAPLRILAENIDKLALANQQVPDLSQHPMALATMQPAISGSCAIMALFDTAHQNLYVACTGDSRAVAGVYEETEDGNGSWRVEVLSEDQTGRNPSELKRMQSEHPADEANTVIMRGRVLGGLEPTRAFGDARYKWPRDVQEALHKAFMEGNAKTLRAVPSMLKTPPYVTARPEVTHRKLSLPPYANPSTKPKSMMRFLLSSEEVVALVGGHLAGLKGSVPKAQLPEMVRTTSGSPTVNGKSFEPRRSTEGKWAFVDDNVCTHLIRNALGGADESKLRKLLSIPAPLSRSYRDDITVTVVWWEDGPNATPEQVRAKL